MLSLVTLHMFGEVTFCCTVFIVVLYLPLSRTVCLQQDYVQTYVTYSVWFSVLTVLLQWFFPYRSVLWWHFLVGYEFVVVGSSGCRIRYAFFVAQ